MIFLLKCLFEPLNTTITHVHSFNFVRQCDDLHILVMQCRHNFNIHFWANEKTALNHFIDKEIKNG